LKFSWRIALGFALSAALLYWALHDVKWGLFLANIRASDPWYWLLAIVASFLTFPLRARRWRTILDPVEPNLPFGPLWRSVAVGMMANNVLPGRIGEVVRAYALTREVPRIPFTTSLGSLVVDRVFDAVVTLSLLLIAMMDPAFSTATNLEGKTVGGIVALVGAIVVAAFAVLYFAVFKPHVVETIAARTVRIVAPKLEPRVTALIQPFIAGLAVIRDGRRFIAIILLTAAQWMLNAAAFWFGFMAVGIDIPYTGALFVQGIIVIGIALPSAPGFVGPFEKAAELALAAYAIGTSQAAAWALGYHVLTFTPITVVGLWYANRLGLSLGQLRTTSTPRTP
jgi:uncharacterized protein (TIRG00374 family)